MSKQQENFLDGIIQTMKAQYGDAAKSFWVYAEEQCPGCRERNIDEFMLKGQRAVSINGFMYHEQSVLIAYFLCGACAKQIHANTVYRKTALHESIETCLKEAYRQYLSTLDA